MTHATKSCLTTVIIISLLTTGLSTVYAKSDREQAGLIGSVKTIAEECSASKGENIPSDVPTRTTYNREGNIIERKSISPTSGKVLETSLTTYQPGNLARETVSLRYLQNDGTFSIKGFVSGKHMEIIDRHGNITERTDFRVDGTVTYRTTYFYDDKGHKTESMTYMPDGSVRESVKYSYDNKGKMIEKILFRADNSMDGRLTVDYGTHGLITGSTLYDIDGTISGKSTTVYDEYDSAGNWTKETSTSWIRINGTMSTLPAYVCKRTITYY